MWKAGGSRGGQPAFSRFGKSNPDGAGTADSVALGAQSPRAGLRIGPHGDNDREGRGGHDTPTLRVGGRAEPEMNGDSAIAATRPHGDDDRAGGGGVSYTDTAESGSRGIADDPR